MLAAHSLRVHVGIFPLKYGEMLPFWSPIGFTEPLLRDNWMTSHEQYVVLVLFIPDGIHGNYRLPMGGVLCLQDTSEQQCGLCNAAIARIQ